jgi:hypothetical protein
VLRAHYTIDVCAAVFTALGAEMIAQRVAPWIDVWLQ